MSCGHQGPQGLPCTRPEGHSDNHGNAAAMAGWSRDPGRKDDGGKPRWDLLPFRALGHVVQVLTIGAKKYAPDNWQIVPDAKSRYFAAAQRHVTAWWADGQKTDPETGEPHLAHAICCLLFLLAFEVGCDKTHRGANDTDRNVGG